MWWVAINRRDGRGASLGESLKVVSTNYQSLVSVPSLNRKMIPFYLQSANQADIDQVEHETPPPACLRLRTPSEAFTPTSVLRAGARWGLRATRRDSLSAVSKPCVLDNAAIYWCSASFPRDRNYYFYSCVHTCTPCYKRWSRWCIRCYIRA